MTIVHTVTRTGAYAVPAHTMFPMKALSWEELCAGLGACGAIEAWVTAYEQVLSVTRQCTACGGSGRVPK